MCTFNITIDDNMGNKDKIIKRVYEAGDIIYYDPVTDNECNDSRSRRGMCR